MKKARTITGIIVGAVALAGAIACGSGGNYKDDVSDKPYATIGVVPAETTTPGSADPTTTAPKKAATTKPVSAEQANATLSAESYLNGQFFSRTELIDQLVYEGYPKKAATAAVDSLHVDWNAQAAGSAISYLKHQSFSKKGLIEQLEYEGFTHKQAVYGVSKSGL